MPKPVLTSSTRGNRRVGRSQITNILVCPKKTTSMVVKKKSIPDKGQRPSSKKGGKDQNLLRLASLSDQEDLPELSSVSQKQPEVGKALMWQQNSISSRKLSYMTEFDKSKYTSDRSLLQQSPADTVGKIQQPQSVESNLDNKLKLSTSAVSCSDIDMLSTSAMINSGIRKSSDSGRQRAVYVAAMNMRGAWAKKPPDVACRILNVTSMQGKESKARRDFSPMAPFQQYAATALSGRKTPSKYEGFHCFENYWQSGKVIAGIDQTKHVSWWKAQKSGKRRYPEGKGKKVLHSVYDDGIKRGYLQARKEIYVPLYYELIKEREMFREWKSWVADVGDTLAETTTNKNDAVVVYDFDGPRKEDGSPTCEIVTVDLLKQKINDPKFPFGHGYVVAAGLAGILPQQYCDPE